jgi:hypothetical protein
MTGWSRWWWSAGALAVLATGAAIMAEVAAPADAAVSVKVKVSPNHGLVNGQIVVISGHGLARSYDGAAQTWFVTECNAAVRGHISPATDTSHCDITDAKAIRVAHNGSFSTHFRIRTGIIGDGYCGTAGHPGCVIGVGTAQGFGTVVKITFGPPPSGLETTVG